MTHPDRILVDRLTSGELVARMERIAADPIEQAKRAAFHASMRERVRIESIGFHCNEALELIALDHLEEQTC